MRFSSSDFPLCQRERLQQPWLHHFAHATPRLPPGAPPIGNFEVIPIDPRIFGGAAPVHFKAYYPERQTHFAVLCVDITLEGTSLVLGRCST
uniref:Uncharacterized protein n=1 Tax=mine drainage metagenome TaxID=410659 RepID=E6Q6X3_9ZZZZ